LAFGRDDLLPRAPSLISVSLSGNLMRGEKNVEDP
jgi:hypothetical protein